MTEFQMKLLSRLTPMPKETFKEMLEVNEDVQIFYGDPREPGILGRAYFASFEDNTYLISYMDWDYNEEEQDSEVIETFSNYGEFWDYLIEMMEDADYFPEYHFLPESSPSSINEAFKRKVTKEQFRKIFGWTTIGQPIFHTRGKKPTIYYTASVSMDGIKIETDISPIVAGLTMGWAWRDNPPQKVGYLPNFDALWDYIIKMVSNKEEYVGEYEYIDSRLTESLTESKRDPFHEAIFEVIDYLTEFSDIFPVPKNIGSMNWEELKDDINYGLSSDFEIAEILMEYLKKDIAIAEKHPEMFEDDPQSELTLEMYIRLKRAFDKAVAVYEAANPEDFQENFSNESKSTALNESLVASAGELALAALEWTVGGYVGFTIGGWIWDVTKDLLLTFRNHVRKIIHQDMTSQWIAYKSYLIEIPKNYEINIWNPGGELLYTGLSSLEAAKRKINHLPIPEIVAELSVAIEDALLENPPSAVDQEPPDVEFVSETSPSEPFTGDPARLSCEEEPIYMTADELRATFGTDDVNIINAGRDETPVALRLEESAVESENDPISNTSDSDNDKVVNTSEIDGLDFEEACRKYNVKVES